METVIDTNFDVATYRKDFPILNREVNGSPLVYFDNGATAQKPQCVIDRIDKYYQFENANIHRGVHRLSQDATNEYEEARKTIQKYLNAEFPEEIVFTKGTTDSINTLAHIFAKTFLRNGGEVVISTMEHHSNIVPWQIACELFGATLKVIPINEKGELLMDEYEKLLNENTKIVAVTHVSNTLGTVNPVKEIVSIAHKKNIPVMLDGAQSTPHHKIDVKDLDCDFYVFSGHKVFGPTGIGVLYGKKKWLNELPPYQGGGEMIDRVTFEKTTYNELPYKYEAGTPNICGAFGLAAAIRYIEKIGLENIEKYEEKLLHYATEKLKTFDGLKIYGEAAHKSALISFNIDGLHNLDVGMILDQQGIAVRTGHHCTQPLMDFYKIPGTVRASFAFYNTFEEIDKLCAGVAKAIKMLK